MITKYGSTVEVGRNCDPREMQTNEYFKTYLKDVAFRITILYQ